MQTLRKSERLCTFRYKELLFNQGKAFFMYPFRVVYYPLYEANMEPLFFKADVSEYEGIEDSLPPAMAVQNPSWPHRRLPPTAYFSQPAKLLVSVSKKHYKKATHRNRIKRLVKESYRKNKSEFYSFLEDRAMRCLLALVYTGREILPYKEIENKMVLTLQKLCEEMAAPERTSPVSEQ